MNQIVQRISNSKKYRLMKIPRETILDLLQIELGKHPKKADAIKMVKAKLHNMKLWKALWSRLIFLEIMLFGQKISRYTLL